MKKYQLMLYFFLCVVQVSAQTYSGNIVGLITDAKTQEILSGVNIVVVEQPNVGTSSNLEGRFMISGMPVGTYSLKVSLVGYETAIVTNVVVSTGRSTKVMAKLNESAIKVGEVTVHANYFARGNQVSPISTNGFDRAEVKRSPGSVQDVQRVVQNLPGIASSTDNINELIVRGGAPFENLTVMDYMEIPSINHYPNQFNSAGPINMVNIDLVEDVQFSAGGFPAQYGDKMSSVMDITLREGERNRAFASNTGFNMAGIGTLMEGRLADGKGSWILSARQSFLEVLDQIIGMSAISLTAIPKYWDAQAKVVYDLSPTHKLTFNGIFGDSRIFIKGDPKEKNERHANQIDSTSLETDDVHTRQYAYGVSLKSLWGKVGFSVLTLYLAGNLYDIGARQDFTRRVYGSSGDVLDYTTLNSRDVFINKSDESFYAMKFDVFYQVHPQHDLSVGAQIQTAGRWKNSVRYWSDTSRYDLNHDGIFETGPITFPNGVIENDIKFGDASKMYAYISDKYSITPELSFTLGLRYDYFTYSKQSSICPRACLSYQILPPTTTLTLAAGEYYQTQPFPFYSDNRNMGYNRNLENSKSTHVVLGLQHILDGGIKLSVEAYYKRFRDIAVGEQFVYSQIDTFRSDRNLAVGERESYGLEFFLQKKQVENYFGTVSLSLSKTEDFDPRAPKLVDRYPSTYDYPIILNVVSGMIIKGVRTALDELPFYLKYPSYILPFSNEMEVSFRFRYQSGGAYTPRDFVTYQQHRQGGIMWSPGAWVTSNRINSERYPDYSRLDIQWISRFYMQSWNINLYLALQNLYNRKNVFYYEYRSDGTIEKVYQFSFFPVVGVEIEF